MAEIQDIPVLVREFYELAKSYLLQETVEPAKRLGRFAGYSLVAAVLWTLAVVFLAVAGLRTVYDLLPNTPYWEALAYVGSAVVLFVFMALVVKFIPTRGVHHVHTDHTEQPHL